LAVGNLGSGLVGDFGEEKLGEKRISLAVVSDGACAMKAGRQESAEKAFTGVVRQ
jgi:hypothetical protein